MNKLTSIQDFFRYKDSLRLESSIQVRVALATCSRAAGADEIFDFFSEAIRKRGIEATVSATGCMGYCYAEPTVEVALPGKKPVVFGNVTRDRADQIIEAFIKRGEPVDGEVPANYRSINEIT
jgi:NADP-reducing hydrogenase subunit HndB